MSQAIYLAANPVEAEIVKDYLATQGIRCTIRGAFAWGAVGDLPQAEAYPRLYLEREIDRAEAIALIREYERGPEDASRACRQCGELSPGSFAICWSCGTGFGA